MQLKRKSLEKKECLVLRNLQKRSGLICKANLPKMIVEHTGMKKDVLRSEKKWTRVAKTQILKFLEATK